MDFNNRTKSPGKIFSAVNLICKCPINKNRFISNPKNIRTEKLLEKLIKLQILILIEKSDNSKKKKVIGMELKICKKFDRKKGILFGKCKKWILETSECTVKFFF